MTHGPAGVLLPQSVLTSNWFILMATVVAFNTIIYLGLTLAKLVPMPRQFHPRRVRGWLLRMGIDPEKGSAVDDIPRPERADSPDPYENLRRSIARRDIPQAFGLVGAIVIALSITSFITFRTTGLFVHVVQLSLGVAFLILAAILGRRHFRARTVMWTWVVACVVLVFAMSLEAVTLDAALPIAYALMVMTAYAPVALAWRPSIWGAIAMIAILGFMSVGITGGSAIKDLRVVVAGMAALLVSATLLRLRIVALHAISDERARAEALVTTDVLTGALTRHGLLTVMPTVAGNAERMGEQVCVMLFRVNELAKANEQYGMGYGDDVLCAIAAAIKEQVRLGDLVARWGGDEFLVAGIGNQPNADALAHRIQEAVRISGINLGKWPTTVRIGTAAGDPELTTFDRIVSEATARVSAA